MWYEILRFELKYRSKRLDTYVYFLAVFFFSIVGFNFIFENTDLGNINENAPFITANVMAAITGIFMIITSMIMGVPVLRDFQYNVQEIIFVNPIQKKDYLLGKFLGSLVVLLFVFSGLLFGYIFGEFMPWRDQSKIQEFHFWHYLKPFLTVVLPNLFYGSLMFFVTGAISKKLVVVYTQGLIFFLLFILCSSLSNPFLAAIFDPISYRAISYMVQSWSTDQLNGLTIPLENVFLYNRILWLLIGVAIAVFGYCFFRFSSISTRSKKVKNSTEIEKRDFGIIQIPSFNQASDFIEGWNMLKSGIRFYFYRTVSEPSFWAIVIIAIFTLAVNSIGIGASFGVDSYPATYLIVEALQELSIAFFLIIFIYYSGEMIWKERDAKVDMLFDALPTNNLITLSSKFLGLLAVYILLFLLLILAGIIFQASQGYFHFELHVYFIGFFGEIFLFLLIFTFMAFFIQILVNSKYIAFLLVFVFFIITAFLGVFKVGHGLYRFGGGSNGTYSDMNGYGHFLKPYLWYHLYWLFFCLILFVVSSLFIIRGNETAFRKRIQNAKMRMTRKVKIVLTAFATLFIVIGSFIFYNTNILNRHWTYSEGLEFRANYERTLKKYEDQAQMEIVDVEIDLDLYPKQRNYQASGSYILVNKTALPIHEIHIQKKIDDQITLAELNLDRAGSFDQEYEDFGYYVYVFDEAIAPKGKLRVDFIQVFETKGFVDQGSNTEIVENGTFFNHKAFPSIGYDSKYELNDSGDRKDKGLAQKNGKAEVTDEIELHKAMTGDDGTEINFEITISTDSSQTAIAPGYLQDSWTVGKRSYYHYKMDKEMLHFYSIVSAEYEKKTKLWRNAQTDSLVNLEVYFHEDHHYNVDRMLNGMEKSLDYYSVNFSPYQYRQLRIMEFPRYHSFAQSFPNTIPFSEEIGFMMNVDDDLDMPFFISAHETAHQWWGMQVCAANVQGKHFILEALSQYSALMVFQQEYGEKQVQKLLKLEMERYFSGRRSDSKTEVSLDRVGAEEHIYYSKGAINLYALQQYISPDSVNLALANFVHDWNCFEGDKDHERFAISDDLLTYFQAVTPDSLQYILEVLFSSVVWYDNEIKSASYTELSANDFEVEVEINCVKYKLDSLGNEVEKEFEESIEIVFYVEDENGEDVEFYRDMRVIGEGESTIKLRLEKRPSMLVFDAGSKLLNRKFRDCEKKLKER